MEYEINARVKELRERLNLSQKAFAQNMGLGRDVISNIENNRNEVKEYVKEAIYRVYGVRKEWLETNEGEPFYVSPEEDELAAYCAKISSGKAPLLEKIIIKYMRMDEDKRRIIDEFVESLIDAKK